MRTFIHVCLLVLLISAGSQAKTIKLESDLLTVEIDDGTAQWALLDKRSGTRWPSEGMAGPGMAKWLEGDFVRIETTDKKSVHLQNKNGIAVLFALVDGGKIFELSYEGKAEGSVRVLDDALAVTDVEDGYAIVPCREGLLIPVNSGKAFKRVFGTSDYEGCHMSMLGFIKGASALIVTWDDAYVFPELKSTTPADKPYHQKLTATLELRRSARSVRLIPLGKGDWNTIAAGYRRYAEKQGLAITLREKIRRDPHVELMVGA
jgi:hypothetical protein